MGAAVGRALARLLQKSLQRRAKAHPTNINYPKAAHSSASALRIHLGSQFQFITLTMLE